MYERRRLSRSSESDDKGMVVGRIESGMAAEVEEKSGGGVPIAIDNVEVDVDTAERVGIAVLYAA